MAKIKVQGLLEATHKWTHRTPDSLIMVIQCIKRQPGSTTIKQLNKSPCYIGNHWELQLSVVRTLQCLFVKSWVSLPAPSLQEQCVQGDSKSAQVPSTPSLCLLPCCFHTGCQTAWAAIAGVIFTNERIFSLHPATQFSPFKPFLDPITWGSLAWCNCMPCSSRVRMWLHVFAP